MTELLPIAVAIALVLLALMVGCSLTFSPSGRMRVRRLRAAWHELPPPATPRFVPKGVVGTVPAPVQTPARRAHVLAARAGSPLHGGRVVRRPGAVCRVCGEAQVSCTGH